MASRPRGTLYIGVTADIAAREVDHVDRISPGSFTAKHNVRLLVWMEHHDTMDSAIQREKSLKRWRRQWKIELVEAANPQWRVLDARTGEPLTGAEHASPYENEDDWMRGSL